MFQKRQPLLTPVTEPSARPQSWAEPRAPVCALHLEALVVLTELTVCGAEHVAQTAMLEESAARSPEWRPRGTALLR